MTWAWMAPLALGALAAAVAGCGARRLRGETARLSAGARRLRGETARLSAGAEPPPGAAGPARR